MIYTKLDRFAFAAHVHEAEARERSGRQGGGEYGGDAVPVPGR